MNEMIPTPTHGVAIQITSHSEVGIVLSQVPHPDRLSHSLVHWDAVESIARNWDGWSDVNQHFDDGTTLLIPASAVQGMVMLWQVKSAVDS